MTFKEFLIAESDKYIDYIKNKKGKDKRISARRIALGVKVVKNPNSPIKRYGRTSRTD